MTKIIRALLEEATEKTSYNESQDDLKTMEALNIKENAEDIFDAIQAGYLLGFINGYQKEKDGIKEQTK